MPIVGRPAIKAVFVAAVVVSGFSRTHTEVRLKADTTYMGKWEALSRNSRRAKWRQNSHSFGDVASDNRIRAFARLARYGLTHSWRSAQTPSTTMSRDLIRTEGTTGSPSDQRFVGTSRFSSSNQCCTTMSCGGWGASPTGVASLIIRKRRPSGDTS